MQSLFVCLFCDKRIAYKDLWTCPFTPWSLNSFDLSSYSSELRKRHTLRLFLMYLEALGKGVSWGRLGRVSRKLSFLVGKAVTEDLNLKLRSKFNQGFTNYDCLHCAILKFLYSFKENKNQKARDG